jgi:pimeloyl-ACP methyl ester carboxylesterase
MKRTDEPTTYLSSWKSEAARDAFWAMSEELAAEALAVQPEPIDVPTTWGATRAYRWDGEGDPVVFLHGTGGIGLMWGPYAARLQGRAAYAVDTLGDVGRTRQEVAVTGPGDLAGWLGETLDGLDVARAHLAGTSYGGFLALNQAARDPERVISLGLIDPGGLAPLRMGPFLAWGMACMAASLLPGPARRAAARTLRMPAVADPRLMGVARRGFRDHRSRLVPPAPLDDDVLRSVAAPTLLVVPERSEVHDVRAAAARAEALVPTVTVEWIAGAGHALGLSHGDQIADRLGSFLATLPA